MNTEQRLDGNGREVKGKEQRERRQINKERNRESSRKGIVKEKKKKKDFIFKLFIIGCSFLWGTTPTSHRKSPSTFPKLPFSLIKKENSFCELMGLCLFFLHLFITPNPMKLENKEKTANLRRGTALKQCKLKAALQGKECGKG